MPSFSLLTPAKALLRGAAIGYLGARERLWPRAPTTVLVLGHMRSGSSLLCHLLMAHPAVLGCGERNRVFDGAGSGALRRMTVDVHYRRRQLLRRSRWLVDQINHGRFLPDPALLRHPDVRPVFLLRAPRPTIASMVAVLGRHYGMTLDQACAYYQQRLDELMTYARSLPTKRAFALDYEHLIARGDQALRALHRHLGLPAPVLSSEYPTHAFTGGNGDPSRYIRAGAIVRTPPRPLTLAPRVEADTAASYAACWDCLRQSCITFDEAK